ncbi:MAG: hypothetical protein WBE83_11865 [Candidatus Cybelea sp.]|jgi:hypothetical protein
MKSRYRHLVGALAAILVAGCGGVQATGSEAVPPAAAGQRAVSDRRPSYMAPDAKKRSRLMYVGDWATNDVFVYEYPSGDSVGTLSGFDAPYGMCVDKKGDVYIANFYSGNVLEYAHGGTNPLKTYTSVGEPIGCSADQKGDLAVTSFNPGEAIVFAGGDPTRGRTYTAPCEFLKTMGYDDKGNLVGLGEEAGGTIAACALLAGSSSMIVLSGCCTGPIQIDSPGSTMWDGKYLVLADQDIIGKYQTNLIQASLSGTTLTLRGYTNLTGDCFNDYADVGNPFIVGKRNTPVNRRQGKVVIGVNLWCNDNGTSGVSFWHYPAGGDPFKTLEHVPAEPYGSAVSLK